MPRNTREWAHRKIEQANGNLKTAQTYLMEVADKYQEHHPDISAALIAQFEAMTMLQESLAIIRGNI